MCGVNAPRPRGGGETVNWTCPEGHRQADDSPLPERLFCLECDHGGKNPWHEREEVEVVGRRVGEVAYA